MNKSPAASLEITGIDAHEKFVSNAVRYASHEVFHNHQRLVSVKGVSGDALDDKDAKNAIKNADCVVHEVFGSISGAECMTRLLRNIGDNTVVIPDTAGTFFKLCSFSRSNILDMINVKSKHKLHIYRKAAYVRGLNFQRCGGISDNIGVLELYEGGSIPGNAKTWCKKKSQRYTSAFQISRPGVFHALACWIFLGHGDDSSTKKRKREHESFECENKDLMRVRKYEKNQVKKKTVPQRFHRLSTNSMDPITSSVEGAWKNPMLFLPKAIQVAENSTIVVATEVKEIGTKSQYYTISMYYQPPDQSEQKLEHVANWNIGLADLYPWYAYM